MSPDARKLLDAVLKLPPEARAALAGSLIESLDETIDDEAEAAWGQEIQHRLNQVDSGQVETVPWAEARRSILGG